jgi:hypothetical protein
MIGSHHTLVQLRQLIEGRGSYNRREEPHECH